MRKEGAQDIPHGETATVLSIKCDGTTDLDITALRVDAVPGCKVYLLQDGVLYDTIENEGVGDGDLEEQAPPISCDNTFEVRVENQSGYPLPCKATAHYRLRHRNRAVVPSRIKVKANLPLRRRFIRTP